MMSDLKTVRTSKGLDKETHLYLRPQCSAQNEGLEMCPSWLPFSLLPASLLSQVWLKIRSVLLGHLDSLGPQPSQFRGWL